MLLFMLLLLLFMPMLLLNEALLPAAYLGLWW